MAGKEFHFNGVQAVLTDIGIDTKKANMIASASQAVDDFHEEDLIVFDDGKLFYPVVTAHKGKDADNLDSRDASNVWMPFHFFPDDSGVCEPDTANVDKLINFVKTRLDSDTLSEVEKNLYIGILLHILVDTYTHQGFMGLYCRHNDISSLDDNEEIDFGFAVNLLPAIGHGEAYTYPDDPWRKWSYKDAMGKPQSRDNKEVFYQIIHKIPEFFDRLGIDNSGMDTAKAKKYKTIFKQKKDHEKAFDDITKISAGDNADISYKYWKNLTLRGVGSKDNTWVKLDPDNFETSEWYLFQEIAKDIRQFFKQEIFPGIAVKTKVYSNPLS